MWRCFTTKRAPHNSGTQHAKHTGKRGLTSPCQLKVKPPNPQSRVCHVAHIHDTSKHHQAHQYDKTWISRTVKGAPAIPRAVYKPKRTSRGSHSPTQTTGRVFLGSPKMRVKAKATTSRREAGKHSLAAIVTPNTKCQVVQDWQIGWV